MNAAQQIFARHFSATTRRALAKRGISAVGTTYLPGDGSMPYTSGETGYILNDNGTQVVRRFKEVVALAAA